jgi:hypothetical protein
MDGMLAAVHTNLPKYVNNSEIDLRVNQTYHSWEVPEVLKHSTCFLQGVT